MSIDPLLAVPRLLEVAHVAHRLSCGEAFVRRLIRDKRLPAIRLGAQWRVKAEDLETFIETQRQAANGPQESTT